MALGPVAHCPRGLLSSQARSQQGSFRGDETDNWHQRGSYGEGCPLSENFEFSLEMLHFGDFHTQLNKV